MCRVGLLTRLTARLTLRHKGHEEHEAHKTHRDLGVLCGLGAGASPCRTACVGQVFRPGERQYSGRPMRKALLLGLALAAAVTPLLTAAQRARTARTASLEPPGRDGQARIDGDTAILPNGRRVAPAGRVIRTQSYGWGLAVTRDGRHAAIVHKDAVEIVDLAAPGRVRRIPPYRSGDHPELGTGGYM